jgi:hypothetical protein
MTLGSAAFWTDPISGAALSGQILNSHFCTVRDKWILLVHASDNRFHSIDAEGFDVTAGYYVDEPAEEGE